ncbi:hypothetical protein [Streptomyces sp. NPDC085460]|uniref:hypothetical protein n=1 Tax=unclassified Streptomyces TaxID=2593676 RepID=UPI0037D2E966
MTTRKFSLLAVAGAGAAVIGCAALVGCTQEAAPGDGRTERQVAEAYVAALNGEDVGALVKLGPPGYEGVEADARELLAADGGKGLKVESVEVSHEFGDDVASARVLGEEEGGKPFSTYVQLARQDGSWVVVLGHAPGAAAGKDGASPASTERPE